MSVPNVPKDGTPEGASPTGRGYWFTPVPVYLLDAVYDPASPVNASAMALWAHVHRHYAWRERVFPSYARLAKETGQSESAVKRQLNMLKAAGAITWGATYGARGRSSNSYALAAIEPLRFDRDVSPPMQVKNDPHPSVGVKNGPSVEGENDRHPQAKNDLGVKSSSYLESTDDSLSSAVPEQRIAEPPASEERETMAAPDNDNGKATTAQRIVRAAGVLSADEEQPFIAWATTTHQPRGGAWWRTVAANGDLPDLVAAWRAGHVPAAAPERPALPPWCGDLDCSETDRMRSVQDADGYERVMRCPECHPQTMAAA